MLKDSSSCIFQQMNRIELTHDQIQSVATEINFLRLPLFRTTKSSTTRHITSFDHVTNSENYHIDIYHDGNLTAFDRKILIVVEYLYIQQNSGFASNKVVTSFSEIASILGISRGNTSKIWGSLSKLRSVEIRASIKLRKDTRTTTVESEFNLLYAITRIFGETQKDRRRYTSRLEILLNDWHVDNFKNNYYRIVNLELLVGLRSGIAVRLFDYLNYKAFYYDAESAKYRQKMKIRVCYQDLVRYLHIAERPGVKEVKRQFRTYIPQVEIAIFGYFLCRRFT